jgi:hypothetical protein
MTPAEILYLSFGLLLVGALAWLTVHYYSGKRRGQVERAKYQMMDDED